MDQPSLHVQNVFDTLNPLGTGVEGYLKLKCLQVQDRVVAMAGHGDIVAISGDCSPEFVNYMLGVTGATNVSAIRYQVSRDLSDYLSARSVFEELARDTQWEVVRRRQPVLIPYMKSAAVYEAARASGIAINEQEWEMVVKERWVELMNDKAIFHQTCEKHGIPIPKFWIVNRKELTGLIIDLFKKGYDSLYIRQTRSGGAFGSVSVKRANSRYYARELSSHALGLGDFVQLLEQDIEDVYWDEFVVTEFLDLYASPGTLFFTHDKGVTVICHTHQILRKDRRFLGFTYPIEDELVKRHFKVIEESLHRLIEPWRQRGYRGYGNIDWMVTRDGDSYFAELNARQTGIVPPIKIENDLSLSEISGPSIGPPALSIITRDRIYFKQTITFEDVYAELKKNKLLVKQGKNAEGVVITIPPMPRFGINSMGLMAVAENTYAASEIFSRSLHTLGVAEEDLLFDLKV